MKIKKLVSVVLTAVVMMGLAACGSSDSSASSGSKDKLAQIKEKGSISVATSPDFAPSEFYILDEKGNKSIVGSDIEFAKAIAKEIGVELEIKGTDFNGVLLNAQSGEADMAISGIAYTKERSEVLRFSEGYSREEEDGFQGLLIRKEDAAKYKSLDDIKKAGLKIGAQQASIQAELAENLTDPSNIKLLATIDVLGMSLNAGDIDAVVVSTSSAEPLVATLQDLVILPQDKFDLDPEDLYSSTRVCFEKSDEYDSLIEVVNKVIKDNTENKNFDKWVEEAKAKMDYQVE